MPIKPLITQYSADVKVAWDWYWEAKLTCRGKTLWGTLNLWNRKGLWSWHSCKCVPSQLLYTERAAFWSERKQSFKSQYTERSDVRFKPAWCMLQPALGLFESGCVPASLSPTKRRASGQPRGERPETLAQPSCLWARLDACTGRGGSSFFWLQASVSGEPRIMKKTRKKRKEKDSVLFVNGT